MSDPRTQHGYKQKHPQERVELLLGAILDELKKIAPPAPQAAPAAPSPTPVAPTSRRQKSN